MGMKKSGSTTAVAEAPKEEKAPTKLDSGTAAAVNRLSKKTVEKAPETGMTSTLDKKYVGRDFEGETLGKIACASFAAAFASNYYPGTPVKSDEEYLDRVEKGAERMIAFVLRKQNRQ